MGVCHDDFIDSGGVEICFCIFFGIAILWQHRMARNHFDGLRLRFLAFLRRLDDSTAGANHVIEENRDFSLYLAADVGSNFLNHYLIG